MFIKMFGVVTSYLWSCNIRKEKNVYQYRNINVLISSNYKFPNTDDEARFSKRINEVMQCLFVARESK